MNFVRNCCGKIHIRNIPQQRNGRWNLFVLGLILSLLITACARTADAVPATQSSDETAQSAGSANSADAVITGDGTTGTVYTTSARRGSEEFGLSKQELVESIEHIEGLIAQCMNEAGFEYIAVDYNTVRRGMTSDKSLPGYSEAEFMREFGFGISTLYDGQPPQLAGLETSAKIGLGEQNARIFASLSPADQVAYTRTLFGEYPQATLAVTLEAENFSLTGGCTRQAIEQVFAPEELNATYMNPFDLERQQDPRLAGRYQQFAECMRSHGFNYSLEQEIEPDLRKRLFAITKNEPVEALSAEASVALENLREEELAIAAALFDCGEP